MSSVHSEQIAVAAGVALLTAGILRMLYLRSRVGRTLATALRHPDPRVRAAAVRSAAENSVARHVHLLATVAQTETHAGVVRVLAQTICEHRWEPATSRTMVELRMWAYAYRDYCQLPRTPAGGMGLSARGSAGPEIPARAAVRPEIPPRAAVRPEIPPRAADTTGVSNSYQHPRAANARRSLDEYVQRH
jgi:hypothetical protein